MHHSDGEQFNFCQLFLRHFTNHLQLARACLQDSTETLLGQVHHVLDDLAKDCATKARLSTGCDRVFYFRFLNKLRQLVQLSSLHTPVPEIKAHHLQLSKIIEGAVESAQFLVCDQLLMAVREYYSARLPQLGQKARQWLVEPAQPHANTLSLLKTQDIRINKGVAKLFKFLHQVERGQYSPLDLEPGSYIQTVNPRQSIEQNKAILQKQLLLRNAAQFHTISSFLLKVRSRRPRRQTYFRQKVKPTQQQHSERYLTPDRSKKPHRNSIAVARGERFSRSEQQSSQFRVVSVKRQTRVLQPRENDLRSILSEQSMEAGRGEQERRRLSLRPRLRPEEEHIIRKVVKRELRLVFPGLLVKGSEIKSFNK